MRLVWELDGCWFFLAFLWHPRREGASRMPEKTKSTRIADTIVAARQFHGEF
jgi:hypothetical protein